MKYQEIREAFPECGVTVSPQGISLVFPYYIPDRWVSAPVNEDQFHNMQVFQELLSCDSIEIALSPGKYAKMLFNMQIAIGNSLMFPPLNKPQSGDEIIAEASEGFLADEEFVDIFKDIDPGNIEEILNGFQELNERKKGIIAKTPMTLSGVQRWKILREESEEFLKRNLPWERSIEPPTKGIDFGTIEFYIEASQLLVFKICQTDMPAFRKMCFAAASFDISSHIENDFANMVFDVFS